MSCSGAYWLLGGGWFQGRYGGFWMVSYSLIFHVVRSFLVFSGFGLKSPVLWISVLFFQQSQDFSSYTALIIKTFRLMLKRFSTLRDNQRGSQSYTKNRRGRKEIEVSRRRKRGTQEERDRSTQLSVPYMFSVAQTPTKIHRLDWKEMGKGGNRGVLRQKTESQKWERVINTLLNRNGN